MISYSIYKILHLVSIFVFLTGAAILLVAEKKSLALKITVGLAAFMVLFAGMGLMARLGSGFQPWIWAKIVIWFVITGASHMIAKRFPRLGWPAYFAMLVLASSAAYLAIFKPF